MRISDWSSDVCSSDLRDVAMTNLEATTSATLLASLEPEVLSDRDAARFAAAMDQLSKTAFAAYRDLVYGTAGVQAFFRQLNPLQEISGLTIGPRPARRTKRQEERRGRKEGVSTSRSGWVRYYSKIKNNKLSNKQ